MPMLVDFFPEEKIKKPHSKIKDGWLESKYAVGDMIWFSPTYSSNKEDIYNNYSLGSKVYGIVIARKVEAKTDTVHYKVLAPIAPKSSKTVRLTLSSYQLNETKTKETKTNNTNPVTKPPEITNNNPSKDYRQFGLPTGQYSIGD